MFTENEKRTIRENQLCLDNESMSMKLELLFTENKRLREALKQIIINAQVKGHDDFTPVYLAKQALGE